MTSKSVCRRLAVLIKPGLSYTAHGVALYTPSGAVELGASQLREIADTLDHLTAVQQAKEEK